MLILCKLFKNVICKIKKGKALLPSPSPYTFSCARNQELLLDNDFVDNDVFGNSGRNLVEGSDIVSILSKSDLLGGSLVVGNLDRAVSGRVHELHIIAAADILDQVAIGALIRPFGRNEVTSDAAGETLDIHYAVIVFTLILLGGSRPRTESSPGESAELIAGERTISFSLLAVFTLADDASAYRELNIKSFVVS